MGTVTGAMAKRGNTQEAVVVVVAVMMMMMMILIMMMVAAAAAVEVEERVGGEVQGGEPEMMMAFGRKIQEVEKSRAAVGATAATIRRTTT